MKGLLKEELKHIFKNKKILIPILALLFIPVLYSGMFLWAFWDPYAHMEDLPVVIVNDDSGAEFESEHLQLGNELVKKLKESSDFNYEFKSKSDAYQGLKDLDYYLLVEIPENFSKNATTLLDEEPQKLNLKYVPNESYNFLASQIGETAMEKIKASLSEKVTETYAETLFSKINEMTHGLEQASDGAYKLNDGSLALHDGTTMLHEKLKELASKSIQFKEGMNNAHSGSEELMNGIATLNQGLADLGVGHSSLSTATNEILAGHQRLENGISSTKTGLESINEKMPALTNGTEQIVVGTKELSNSIGQWKQGADDVHQGVKLLKQQLKEVIPYLKPEQQQQLAGVLLQLEGGTSQLSQSASALADGAGKIANNLETVNKNQNVLAHGLESLAEGGATLEKGSQNLLAGLHSFQLGMTTFEQKFLEAKTGSEQLMAGADVLSGGLEQLGEGTNKISSGAQQLEQGSGKLADGTNTLKEGSEELADKLANGAEEAGAVHANDKTFNMMGNPVQVENDKFNEVPNYGTGFAPYFVSLGLFVGALLLSIVFPLREPAAIPKSAWSWFSSKFTILSIIGIIQGLIVSGILLVGLGLEVKSIPMFFLFMIATSITFVSLIQFLVTVFGDPGRFIAILILIFQLTTSAGTFPLELIPNILQKFNAFLPMTYTVAGFKAVISSGDYAAMWQNIGLLVVFTFITVIGTMLFFKRMHRRQFHTLAKVQNK